MGARAPVHALCLVTLASLALASAPVHAGTAPPPPPATSASTSTDWPFTHSDLTPDPAFRFGRLANGMRYIIRANQLPKGEVQLRLLVHAGSLDEREDERGFAHFVEHMAFEGSTHVPAGQMVPLLERKGLAFGADTNAFTNYDWTAYHLNLPRNDADLVDTALMLMRETASELAFTPDAITRERGVVLAEKRDRDNWQQREMISRIGFIDPDAYYARRLPIGTDASLAAATSERLRAFWRRNYVPSRVTLVVVGDIDAAAMEKAIAARFGDWRAAASPPQPNPGPVDFTDGDRVSIYTDPALSERIMLSRHGPWLDEPDSLASRKENLLRRIGYGIINRRMQRLGRLANPPFRDAGLGTGDTFHVGRTTNLVVDAIEGQWKRALTAAVLEYRRALAQGFTQEEVAEQLANLNQQVDHGASAADTRNTGDLTRQAMSVVQDELVPEAPALLQSQFDSMTAGITPAMVLAALQRELVPLDHPLIRFQGRNPPAGGEAALRETLAQAFAAPLPAQTAAHEAPFAYTYFGPPGRVVADTREPLLGLREVRFANGVRLNLKRTALVHDQVLFSLRLDGGQMLDTRTNPLAVAMTSALGSGGLGRHSLDDIQSLMAGHQVGVGLSTAGDTFQMAANTTPADLLLELQLASALLTDPGYRPEGALQYHLGVNNYFAQLRSTPGGVMGAALGGILSDDDPRYTLQPVEDFRRLTYAKLALDLNDRLNHGALEIGLVGDIDEDKAIAQVAATLGALPTREPAFEPYPDQRLRPFTNDHALRILRHAGPKDQALIRFVWKTRDDSDPEEKQVLNLLQRVVQIRLTEGLREKLGKAYSPGASSEPSRVWRGYGTFSIGASVNVGDVAVAMGAMRATVAALRAAPPSADLMQRARAPLAQIIDNAFKTNAGWLDLASRAQSEPDQIERQLKAHERLMAVTPEEVSAAARRYLADADAVPVLVLPDGVAAPGVPQSVPTSVAGDTTLAHSANPEAERPTITVLPVQNASTPPAGAPNR